MLYYIVRVPAVVMTGSEMVPEESRRKTQFSSLSWARSNFRSLMPDGFLPVYVNTVQFGERFPGNNLSNSKSIIKLKA